MLSVAEGDQPATQINLLMNWFEELKARVPDEVGNSPLPGTSRRITLPGRPVASEGVGREGAESV